MADIWLSPTGHNDPDSQWIDEAKAYDGDTGTYAASSIAAGSWSSFLELTIDAISCDKVRFNARYSGSSTNSIDLDVYYGGDWHDVYEGSFTDAAWVEKELGGTYQVTKARVRFYNTNVISIIGRVYEFAFNQYLEAGVLPATIIRADGARLNGEVVSGDDCEARFAWWKVSAPAVEDTFEWGSDGDPLSDDGGGIDWTITVAGSSKAEIDTDQKYEGTRSARLYRDGTYNAIAYFSQAPLTSSQVLSFYARRDGDTRQTWSQGDGSKRWYVRFEDDKLVYFDGGWNTISGVTIADKTWYKISVANFDWTAGTYDIYLNGVLVSADTPMGTSTAENGVIRFACFTITGSDWFDNVRIHNKTITAWDGGSYDTDDEFYYDLTGLDAETEYIYQCQVKNDNGESAWSDEKTFTTIVNRRAAAFFMVM